VGGLYMVLWGKSKEMKKSDELVAAHSPHEEESVRVEVVVRGEVEDESKQKKRHENDEKLEQNSHVASESNQGRDEEKSNTLLCT